MEFMNGILICNFLKILRNLKNYLFSFYLWSLHGKGRGRVQILSPLVFPSLGFTCTSYLLFYFLPSFFSFFSFLFSSPPPTTNQLLVIIALHYSLITFFRFILVLLGSIPFVMFVRVVPFVPPSFLYQHYNGLFLVIKLYPSYQSLYPFFALHQTTCFPLNSPVF